eukprot:COSAG05_NODE_2929_length_2495_cov_1.626461_4_plen_182_part_00
MRYSYCVHCIPLRQRLFSARSSSFSRRKLAIASLAACSVATSWLVTPDAPVLLPSSIAVACCCGCWVCPTSNSWVESRRTRLIWPGESVRFSLQPSPPPPLPLPVAPRCPPLLLRKTAYKPKNTNQNHQSMHMRASIPMHTQHSDMILKDGKCQSGSSSLRDYVCYLVVSVAPVPRCPSRR